MAHRDRRNHRRGLRLPAHGRRTRIVVTLTGLLLSLAVSVIVSGDKPALTVDQQVRTHAPHDLAGLGVTGALSGDPLPSDAAPSHPAPSAPPADFVGAQPPGPPVAHAVPAAVSGDLLRSQPPATPAPHPIPGEGPGDSVDAGPPRIAVPPNLPDGPLGIPGVMLGAYQRAAQTLAATQPGCHLSWSVLAGIGRIESDHASDGRVNVAGNTLGPILGPRLDGSPGMAALPDTDHGVLDQDTIWDRAVGPMQFIPSSWRRWGVGNPNNIYDSTLAAGRYLCAGAADLSQPAQLQTAVYRYNHSTAYVNVVLQWAAAYLTGVIPTPSAPGSVPPGTNGNGGHPVVPDSAPPASAALAAVAQPGPLATAFPTTPPPHPTTTTTTPPTAPAIATTPPTMTPPTMTPRATTPTPSPPSPTTTTTPLVTVNHPVTTTSPLPPPPPTTTTPIEPASSPPPPPPLPPVTAPSPTSASPARP